MREMKDSGISWVGEIPTNWTIGRIGGLYSLRNQKVSDKDYEPLSVTMKGVLPQLETVAKTNDGDNRKLVRKGDFAINNRSDRRGSCGIADRDGSVSLINTILKPRNQMNARYYNWLFHTPMFADEFYKWGHGIVDDLWSTNWEEMKKIQIPFPSLAEQQRIAEFLDGECGKIDGLKADIQAQIDTLEQYKRSVITEAVTHGLNPSVPMKDSGIPWFDEVSQNWDIRRVKYIATCLKKGNGITKEDIVEGGNTLCIRYGEIYTKYNLSFFECTTRTNKERISSKQYFTQGDILFAGTGELIEEIGKNIVYLGTGDCLAGGDIIILKHKQNARYLNYALNSECVQAQKSCNKAKLKVVHISAFEIGNIKIALPPLDEQQEIADYLDNKCAEIEQIIADKKSQIETLDGYKKSLIYEYVTGKKEVV